MSYVEGFYPIEAELAEKRRYFAEQKPRGCFILSPGTDEEERIAVPAAVARSIKRRLDAGELYPACRSEALYLLKEVSRSCAAQRVSALLNRRDYAVNEIRQKLGDDGYTAAIIDEVVERACAGRALDDQRFAETYIRSKLSAGWGLQRISRELRQRGIEVEQVDGWPDAFVDEESEGERAYQLASRRRLTGKNDYPKLVRFLITRGFAMSDATSAAKRVLAQAASA